MINLSKRRWSIAIGLFPAITVYLVFAIYPIIQSAYYSLFEWDGLSGMRFVDFDNYGSILKDSLFWSSLKNNLLVVLASIFGQLPLGLILALVLHKKVKGSSFFRTVLFMPVVISTVVVSLVWSMVYNYQFGLLNTLLRLIGLDSWTHNWLGESNTAIFSVCITMIWQYAGLYVIIFLSALQNVSSEVLESADMDGASGLRKVWLIVVPMISETLFSAIVLCISGSLRTFDLIYVMTAGGPNHQTDVMAIYMFNKTFSSLQYGYGSAISILIFIISLTFIIVVDRVMRRLRQ